MRRTAWFKIEAEQELIMSEPPSNLTFPKYLSRGMMIIYVVACVGAAMSMLILGANISHASRMPRSRIPRSYGEGSHVPVATPASALYVKEIARLLPVGSVGTRVKEKGHCAGTLNGAVSSNLVISGSHISGTFVLTTRNGRIDGHTSATVVGQAAVPVVRFAGSLSVTGGSGSYARATGHVSIKGTIRRRNYELLEEVAGTLHY
jgi:hypothetical protein